QMVTPATTAPIQTYILAFTTSPQIPVNLSAATTSGSTSATLTWDLGSLGQTPTAYKIRYALNAQMSGMTETTEFSSPGRSYTLPGLTSGTTYYWEVVSTIGSLSSVSTISTFQMVANTPPVASNGSFITSQNTPYSGYLTATDVNNTPNTSGLIYSVVTAPSSGTAVINNSATGAFTYTPNTDFSGPDSFTFKAFDGAAYSAAATISITVAAVLNPPLIASQPTNMTVVSGSSAAFSVTASGTAPLCYQWWASGAGISAATNASYSLTSARASDAGNYTVVITNLYGSVTSSVAVLTVNKATPVVNTWPSASGITYGQALSASTLS